MTDYSVRPGHPAPLGSTPAADGVNFSVFSEYAEQIELCLFDDFGQKEVARIEMSHKENHVWHIFVEGIGVGTKYGYRAHGPFAPVQGLRFNANKLLIDPYARELDRDFCWDKSLFSFDEKNAQRDLSFDERDSAAVMPKSVVCEVKNADEIEKIQAEKPNIPWQDTIVYEAHARGFSQLNLDIPAAERGTFSGMANDKVIRYLKDLGVTSIELLPIHAFIDEEFLVKQGLSNYWGYNTLSFFAMHQGYSQSGHAREFRDMVKKYHAAGLEIILDVVYNHTAESNEFGPTLSFRGLDNQSYYRLESNSHRYYINDTGCGNTFQTDHPRVMQLVLDSLRYWAGEMGVDGFRFDLASILGRDSKGFSHRAAFFQAISQDPLLSRVKLIAEPWDIGPGGYQLGAYPGEWSEWNDKYRDVCRRFWRGDSGVLPEFARRIHGSSDIFEYAGRKPRASVNFITSHDGFTLADLVAYSERHNLANKEDNRDGHHANFSANYGIEGETDDEEITAIRERQQRNFIATMMLSQGVPMLLAGDELGRSQQGNNNAYCQDNEINWIDWPALTQKNESLLRFTQKVIGLRKRFALFRSAEYIHLPEDLKKERKCAKWFSRTGEPMGDYDWNHAPDNVVGWILQSIDSEQMSSLILLFNASESDLKFTLPTEEGIGGWEILLNTSFSDGIPLQQQVSAGATLNLMGRSMQLLIANSRINEKG